MIIRKEPRLSDLYGDVWCQTCQHTHIPTIPTVTFRCATDCGFGSWSLITAELHATNFPAHNVYAIHHRTEEISWAASGTCMCGSPMEGHTVYDHVPVDSGLYQWQEYQNKADQA